MASSPGYKPSKKRIEHARKTGASLPDAREPIKRPGPRVGQAQDALDACQQSERSYVPSDAEMAAALGIKRVRDYRRRVKAVMVELHLLAPDGALAPGWLEALEIIREHGEEQEQGRRLREQHATARADYREHLREQAAKHQRSERKHRAPREQPPHQSREAHPDPRVAWLERTGMRRDFAAREVSTPSPASPAKAKLKLVRHRDDWRDHPLTCECPRCSATEPSYAKPRFAGGVP